MSGEVGRPEHVDYVPLYLYIPQQLAALVGKIQEKSGAHTQRQRSQSDVVTALLLAGLAAASGRPLEEAERQLEERQYAPCREEGLAVCKVLREESPAKPAPKPAPAPARAAGETTLTAARAKRILLPAGQPPRVLAPPKEEPASPAPPSLEAAALWDQVLAGARPIVGEQAAWFDGTEALGLEGSTLLIGCRTRTQAGELQENYLAVLRAQLAGRALDLRFEVKPHAAPPPEATPAPEPEEAPQAPPSREQLKEQLNAAYRDLRQRLVGVAYALHKTIEVKWAGDYRELLEEADAAGLLFVRAPRRKKGHWHHKDRAPPDQEE